ncbi:hypothetical protein HYH03_018072 [Edaphochlamys debaryana]|uniref:Uncharacterized protein n=1 Tax=Edaphochlamys debaryana TaxID=47281 RepID=A0A836BPX4_9CHLO|nr:hypothetical protein HYH03_018072 [Edaphochlamys debaryana]|eukprot:KAG2483043.1 hypothetical protein HYH03_018072 [Edaphochlamys debaryana]
MDADPTTPERACSESLSEPPTDDEATTGGEEGDSGEDDSCAGAKRRRYSGAVSRRAWTAEEHEAMVEAVQQQLDAGAGAEGASAGGSGSAGGAAAGSGGAPGASKKKAGINWALVAQSVPGRTGKQCRERWQNACSRPNLVRGQWTAAEDRAIARGHALWGPAWTRIARQLTTRTENQVKNRWSTIVRNKKRPPLRTGGGLPAYVAAVQGGTRPTEAFSVIYGVILDEPSDPIGNPAAAILAAADPSHAAATPFAAAATAAFATPSPSAGNGPSSPQLAPPPSNGAQAAGQAALRPESGAGLGLGLGVPRLLYVASAQRSRSPSIAPDPPLLPALTSAPPGSVAEPADSAGIVGDSSGGAASDDDFGPAAGRPAAADAQAHVNLSGSGGGAAGMARAGSVASLASSPPCAAARKRQRLGLDPAGAEALPPAPQAPLTPPAPATLALTASGGMSHAANAAAAAGRATSSPAAAAGASAGSGGSGIPAAAAPAPAAVGPTTPPLAPPSTSAGGAEARSPLEAALAALSGATAGGRVSLPVGVVRSLLDIAVRHEGLLRCTQRARAAAAEAAAAAESVAAAVGGGPRVPPPAGPFSAGPMHFPPPLSLPPPPNYQGPAPRPARSPLGLPPAAMRHSGSAGSGGPRGGPGPSDDYFARMRALRAEQAQRRMASTARPSAGSHFAPGPAAGPARAAAAPPPAATAGAAGASALPEEVEEDWLAELCFDSDGGGDAGGGAAGAVQGGAGSAALAPPRRLSRGSFLPGPAGPAATFGPRSFSVPTSLHAWHSGAPAGAAAAAAELGAAAAGGAGPSAAGATGSALQPPLLRCATPSEEFLEAFLEATA